MGKIILERALKLLSVKSIMTLILTVVFAYLSISQIIPGDKYFEIFLMVVTFYFGTQAAKKE